MISAKRGDFDETASRFGIDKVIARLIRNRDVIGDDQVEKYLHGSLDDLYAPELMKDLEKAGQIVIDAIDEDRKIRVIGDYDIDGIMATYILMHALQKLGADVDFAVPDRIRDGYGINAELIREAFADGVGLILTCDNGIAAAEQVELAHELGIAIVITDHHSIPYEEDAAGRRYLLPAADAVVDAKQEDCAYPFKELCGAAVAFKLVCFLFEELGLPKEEAYAYLQFAAIATVGDVVDLKDENRIIVKEGLKQIHTTSHTGLLALIEKCGIDRASVETYHIGFVIGPCLNASGRLDTADRALALLMAKDRNEALVTAGELCELNGMRKAMTENETARAVEIIETSERKNDRVLVVYLQGCHESIAGIIAGRLRERYSRPAFVLTDSKDGVKGSGRSTDAYAMYDELVKVKNHLVRFGGHKAAAGISLETGKSEEFRRAVNEVCELKPEDLEEVVHLDLRLPIGYLSEGLIDQMEVLKPFGKGNERPLFADKSLRIRNASLIGKNRNVLKMRLMDERGFCVDAVCFRDAADVYEKIKERDSVTVSYYPTINEYQGRRSIQLVIRDFML